MLNREKVKEYAAAAGFDLCGVARYRTMPEHEERFDRWLGAGFHGGLEYMERYRDRRFDPARLAPGARTVIVCAVNYNYGMHHAVAAAGAPKIASYALARDYHDVIKGMLGRLCERLRQDDPGMEARCFVDTAPLLEKAWAVEAGLGWIGRNSLLITPLHGSFVLLGEIVTSAVADGYDEPFAGERCGTCMRCVEGCPAGAIREDRLIDARRCIARLTIERPTGQADAALHGWIFGCDACQSACPRNAGAQPATCAALSPIADPALLTRNFWSGLTEAGFDALFGGTPLARCGLTRIKLAIDPCHSERSEGSML